MNIISIFLNQSQHSEQMVQQTARFVGEQLFLHQFYKLTSKGLKGACGQYFLTTGTTAGVVGANSQKERQNASFP